MKKYTFNFICLLIFLLSFFSCKKSSVGKFKVNNFSNGKAGEVILVIEKKFLTEATKSYFEDFLTQPQSALNQEEPMFDLLQFEPKDFTAHFQRHRSIIQFDINSNFASNTLKIEENVWAKPQVHIYFRGNSMDSLLLLFQQNEEQILNTLYNNDLKRVQYYYSTNNDPYIEKKIKDKFNIKIMVPNTYIVAMEEEDFMWLRFRTVKNDRFIIIYNTPGNDLSYRGLIDARNEKTKAYIQGAVKGAYPIVAEVYQFPLFHENVKIGQITGAELRGLWESVGDKMGGPFYHYSFIDNTGKNVVSVGGFVYAPEEDKRTYLREVEAIVKSVK